jgi:hypothetical protein
MKKMLYVLTIAFILWNCDREKKEECVFQPETSASKIDFKFEQFQDSLINIRSKTALVNLLGRQPMMRDFIFRRTEYPNDSVFINTIYNRFANPHIDTLLLESKRVFGDLKDLQLQFENAFSNIQYYYPDFTPPKVQTIICGLTDADLYVSDSLIIVSLDFYLGKGAKYRPKMYEYLLRRYEPEDIVPSCMLIYGISDRFNKNNIADKTVLADMIAYGKSFYFAKHMIPCTPDSVLLSYSAEELNGSRKNEDLIWARFIQDQVLFSTSQIEKRNYLGDRPFTIQVGEKCPGRIGQWVGWRIVDQYMQSNQETTLPQLMSLVDAQKFFKDSNYKPKRR